MAKTILANGKSLILLLNLLLLGQAVMAADAKVAEDILRKARQSLDAKSDKAHLTMKIIEPGGEVKTREMSLQILRTEDGFKSIVRMTAPADIKDTSLLAEIKDGEDHQWLYLPSTKQVRRIATTEKSVGILGSELSPEDLDPMAIRGSSVTLLNNNGKSAQVAVIPRKGTSDYTRIVTTFAMPEAIPNKTEYFKGVKLQKTVEYSGYKSFAGGIFRAQKIHVFNVEKKRATDIEFTEILVNPPLLANDFTPEALKEKL